MFILLIFLASLGVLLLAYAFVKQYSSKNVRADYDKLFSSLDGSVREAENIMGELDDFSNSIKKDFEDKFQEMVQLYNLLEEKKQEIISLEYKKADYEKAEPVILPEEVILPGNKIVKGNKYKRPVSEKIVKIRSMHAEGYTVSKIARALNIGQGEVKLTLDLNRERTGA
ncbi:MAG: hypothetical protein LBV08_03345 [Clostridiales bacterium]|jgi:DNA-directed RNA polymerase specialized sigma subunit|nr:hypothetical protein [Clostridiales bacterium]